MPRTYEPIATTTLGSNQSSVTFNSISGYTDIILVAESKCGNANNFLYLQFNSDSGSNYSYTRLNGDGSSASADRTSNFTAIQIGYPSSSAFAQSIVNVQNYSNSTTNKTTITRTGRTDAFTGAWVGLWRNTAAITSFTLLMGSGDVILAGSTFTLYGIKAA